MVKNISLGILYTAVMTVVIWVCTNVAIFALGWSLVLLIVSSSSQGGEFETSHGKTVEIPPGEAFKIVFVKYGRFAEGGARFTCKNENPGNWDLYIGWSYEFTIVEIEECKIASRKEIFFIP
jgi:hypothetical protein